MTATAKQTLVLHLADEIESAMKKLGLWSSPRDSVPAPTGPFGAGSLTFEEWLQFVMLPNVKTAVATNTLPSRSNVATAAIRNLDGTPGVDQLIELLSRLDRTIEGT